MNLSKRQIVNIIHILIVAPLLGYVGYNAAKTPKMVFHVLLILAIIVASYHAYLFVNQMN